MQPRRIDWVKLAINLQFKVSIIDVIKLMVAAVKFPAQITIHIVADTTKTWDATWFAVVDRLVSDIYNITTIVERLRRTYN